MKQLFWRRALQPLYYAVPVFLVIAVVSLVLNFGGTGILIALVAALVVGRHGPEVREQIGGVLTAQQNAFRSIQATSRAAEQGASVQEWEQTGEGFRQRVAGSPQATAQAVRRQWREDRRRSTTTLLH